MRKVLLSLGLLVAAAVPARAGVAVIDSGQLAQSVAMLQAAGQHLQQLQQLVHLAQQFRSVVGQSGAAAGPFQSGGFTSVFGGGGFGLRSLAPFGRFDPCQMGLCIGNHSSIVFTTVPESRENLGHRNPIGSYNGIVFTTVPYETARSWSNETFFRPTSGSFDDGRRQLAVRRTAGVVAAHDGLAVAIAARQQIARSAERQAALEQAVASARDLRGDVQGAAAVASALYQQERERTALLAALLQLSASRQIASDVRISVPDGARGASAR
jgi:hypothetical protein